MGLSREDTAEVIRQALRDAEEFARLERRLRALKELRAVNASYLVRNTTCSRTEIAAVLGTSRVTLDRYLAEDGVDAQYLAVVRENQKKAGAVLFDSRDLHLLMMAVQGEAVGASE